MYRETLEENNSDEENELSSPTFTSFPYESPPRERGEIEVIHENINCWLKLIYKKTKKYDVHIVLDLEENDNIGCSHFDPINKKLVLVVPKSENDIDMTVCNLLREYCHMLQWIDTGCMDKYEIWEKLYKWFTYDTFTGMTSHNIDQYYKNWIKKEIKCEHMIKDLIVTNNNYDICDDYNVKRCINLNDFIIQSNARMHFYMFAHKHRYWFSEGKKPPENYNIIKYSMPSCLLIEEDFCGEYMDSIDLIYTSVYLTSSSTSSLDSSTE